MVHLRLAILEFHLSLHLVQGVELTRNLGCTEALVLQSHVSNLHLKQVWHLDWRLLFSEQFDRRSVLHSLSTIGLGVEGSLFLQPLLAVRLAENPGMRTLRLALGSLFSLLGVR